MPLECGRSSLRRPYQLYRTAFGVVLLGFSRHRLEAELPVQGARTGGPGHILPKGRYVYRGVDIEALHAGLDQRRSNSTTTIVPRHGQPVDAVLIGCQEDSTAQGCPRGVIVFTDTKSITRLDRFAQRGLESVFRDDGAEKVLRLLGEAKPLADVTDFCVLYRHRNTI